MDDPLNPDNAAMMVRALNSTQQPIPAMPLTPAPPMQQLQSPLGPTEMDGVGQSGMPGQSATMNPSDPYNVALMQQASLGNGLTTNQGFQSPFNTAPPAMPSKWKPSDDATGGSY